MLRGHARWGTQRACDQGGPPNKENATQRRLWAFQRFVVKSGGFLSRKCIVSQHSNPHPSLSPGCEHQLCDITAMLRCKPSKKEKQTKLKACHHLQKHGQIAAAGRCMQPPAEFGGAPVAVFPCANRDAPETLPHQQDAPNPSNICHGPRHWHTMGLGTRQLMRPVAVAQASGYTREGVLQNARHCTECNSLFDGVPGHKPGRRTQCCKRELSLGPLSSRCRAGLKKTSLSTC